MNDIELKWVTAETGKKLITAEGISTNIEINENNKDIKNAKTFFREVIYQSFINNIYHKIVLVEDKDNEIPEVKIILNELIELCNTEIESKLTKQG